MRVQEQLSLREERTEMAALQPMLPGAPQMRVEHAQPSLLARFSDIFGWCCFSPCSARSARSLI